MSHAPRRHAPETYYRSLPHVSVVVPVKDTAPELLRSAVASAVHQDCADHVEIVVWNDGSTDDGTLAALADLPRLTETGRPVRIGGTPDNRGISAARNAACAMANGTWFLWLDSDDTLPTDAVRNLLAATGSRPQIVFGRCRVTIPEGREVVHHAEKFVRDWRRRRGTVGDPLAGAVFAVHGGLVHRDLFDAVGGFEESLRFAELTDWVMRIMATADPSRVALTSKTTYHYVKRGDSHSSARYELENHRVEALRRYSRSIDPLIRPTFDRRCPETGARLYALASD